MNDNVSYIMAFTHINNDYSLPNLYFVSDNSDSSDIYNDTDNIIFKTKYNHDKIHKMHQVLYSVKQYFDNGSVVTIKHLSNDLLYSQYIMYNDDWLFVDLNDKLNVNILNLPHIIF